MHFLGQGTPVDPTVLVEAVVLRDQNGPPQVGRDLRQREPFPPKESSLPPVQTMR